VPMITDSGGLAFGVLTSVLSPKRRNVRKGTRYSPPKSKETSFILDKNKGTPMQNRIMIDRVAFIGRTGRGSMVRQRIILTRQPSDGTEVETIVDEAIGKKSTLRNRHEVSIASS
jgi:hypothetical protein